MDKHSSIIVENVSFENEGYKLLGRIYRPNVTGKFPAVVLCHGYPGDAKNMDLAEELAFNNIVSFVFYYRGAWGSEGAYSLRALDPSARDAIEFLRSRPFVDSGRVGVIGHSMGAVPASKRLSADPKLKTGVFMAPAAGFAARVSKEHVDQYVERLMSMGEGKLNALSEDVLRSDLLWLAENLDPKDVIRSVKVPLLFIVGSNDTATTPEACRLLYENANQPKHFILIDGADHIFSEHKVPLINSIVNWMREHLKKLEHSFLG